MQYRCKGRQRRYTIGCHGSPWTVDEARTEAVRLLGEVVRGNDPADLKRGERADVTFSVFADRYLREHADLHKKPRSAELDRWLLRTHILPAIASRRLGEFSVPTSRDCTETWQAPRSRQTEFSASPRLCLRWPSAGGCARRAQQSVPQHSEI